MEIDLIWLEQAEDDLQSIFDYISIDNAGAAETYTGSLVSACDRLRHFPLSGRAFSKRYRVLIVRNHLVLYRYERVDHEIIIAGIIDGRRDVAAWLRTLKDNNP